MPLVETESLVLKSYNLAEADRIVVLLTRDHGLVRGVAKGAKRLKSKFGSGLEPFSFAHVTYLQKENIELVTLQKVELLRSNFAAAGDPDFLNKFSYLADLLTSFMPPHDPNEMIFRMAKACIEKAVADPSSLSATGVYFELWLLRLAGFLPDWSRCADCRRELDDAEEANIQASFHMLCTKCRKSASSRIFSGTHRALVAAAMKMSPTDFAVFVGAQVEELGFVSSVLRSLISHSLGREVKGDTPRAVVA
jgi:DNA repair protein RecO (recombination protein O)